MCVCVEASEAQSNCVIYTRGYTNKEIKICT